MFLRICCEPGLSDANGEAESLVSHTALVFAPHSCPNYVFAAQVAVMNLPAPAESLCLAYMAAEQAAGGSNEQLFLYIGLTNGVCQRVRERRAISARFNGYNSCALSQSRISLCKLNCAHCSDVAVVNRVYLTQVAVDATAGTLSDPRQRFLGSKPVKLFRIQVQDKRGVSCSSCFFVGDIARKWAFLGR